MALVVITVQDGPQGPSVSVNAEPPMPSSVLGGAPSPAQAAAAIMLNALSQVAGPAANESRIITPH
jgi:hypothetical protein